MIKNILGLATGCIVALSLTACGETPAPAPEAPAPKAPATTTQQKPAVPADKMKGETKKAGDAKGTTGEMDKTKGETKKAGDAKSTTGEMDKKSGEAVKPTPDSMKKN